MDVLKIPELCAKKGRTVVELPVSKISFSAYHCGRYPDPRAVGRLSRSIAAYGVLEPVWVRKTGSGKYELIAGESRLMASQTAGKKTIPAVVLPAGDQKTALLSILENSCRRVPHFFELAEQYRTLMEDWGLGEEKLAKLLAESPSVISSRIRLLRLETEVRRMIVENGFSEAHAHILLKLPDEEARKEVLKRMAEEVLTLKRTEELVKEMQMTLIGEAKPKGNRREKRYLSDLRLCTNTIRKAVELIRQTGLLVDCENKQDGDHCEIRIFIRKAKETA